MKPNKNYKTYARLTSDSSILHPVSWHCMPRAGQSMTTRDSLSMLPTYLFTNQLREGQTTNYFQAPRVGGETNPTTVIPYHTQTK